MSQSSGKHLEPEVDVRAASTQKVVESMDRQDIWKNMQGAMTRELSTSLSGTLGGCLSAKSFVRQGAILAFSTKFLPTREVQRCTPYFRSSGSIPREQKPCLLFIAAVMPVT